jgi:hypothetical protein
MISGTTSLQKHVHGGKINFLGGKNVIFENSTDIGDFA